MPLFKKILIALMGLAILVLLGLALRPAPIPVSATEVIRGPFAEYVEDEGRTRLRHAYTVTAPIDGYLRRVTLEPGDSVDIDDVLFLLEPAPAPGLDLRSREQAREAVRAAAARQEAARAELEVRQAESRLARQEHERSERLFRQSQIAAEERDRRLAVRDAAQAAERAARHGVDVAGFDLAAARLVLDVADGRRTGEEIPAVAVRAPVAGLVTQRHRYDEGPIQAGEAVLALGNLDDLEVKVDLLSMEAVRLRPGMRVILERWGGGDALEGRVRRVEPAGFEKVSALGVEEQRVYVWSTLASPREQWRHLGDGYRVEARFVLWEGEDVLQIPTSALFRHDDAWAVFMIRDGRARLQRVEIGRRSGLWTQLLEGLNPGEPIITHPGDRVQENSRVRAEFHQNPFR
ncbi:efflux RND transporter periplasmic adaptor subunit [Ectothiorhodospira lacustris]|uniref:efflux RND transporter periplasmic adaptor subunit n=1 Tax=Ectothiorhodospira lacustris TaxID=2899127 RepID=UPI001EE8879C|nr:HlyD family efflux transporter periplasmic adaptor subunit [Ectothiorhodospira lacustris]MCG5501745.1 HlyD family efflux transporter periplasmic adaptor subunit [Ectothiorhodospira lacustris]MCG5510303.1 HlyD family efflux transporter periplasmic adaptor subunit [Ectothiorhodospira lacustris]MCG5522049.1 HlyD family efflux transporter periplasmic adaptor subunit [Ectothiorhodospira lacustris]